MKTSNCDNGSAFVWVIALCAVCMIASVGVANLGKAARLQSRAQNAADAAALSGAYEVAHSQTSRACNAAHEAARKNDSHVVSCEVTPDDIVVTVAMNSDSGFRAQARAEIQ